MKLNCRKKSLSSYNFVHFAFEEFPGVESADVARGSKLPKSVVDSKVDFDEKAEKIQKRIDGLPLSSENKKILHGEVRKFLSVRDQKLREIEKIGRDEFQRNMDVLHGELDSFFKEEGFADILDRLDENITEVERLERQLAVIERQRKDLQNRQEQITSKLLPELFERLNSFTKKNSTLTLFDEEHFIESTIYQIERGEDLSAKFAREAVGLAVQAVHLKRRIYLLKYHEAKAQGKNVDDLLLQVHEDLGQWGPKSLKGEIAKARERALKNPKRSPFQKTLYEGKYTEALAILSEQNQEMTRALGRTLGEHDVVRLWEESGKHGQESAKTFSKDTIGAQLMAQGFEPIKFARKISGWLLVKEDADGALAYQLVTNEGYAIGVVKGYEMKRISPAARKAVKKDVNELHENLKKLLKENPNIKKVQGATAVVQQKLVPLYAMFQAGAQGKKTEGFVELAKRYAKDIKGSAEIATLRETAVEARRDVELLEKFGAGVSDEFEEEIRNYARALDQVIFAVQNNQLDRICDQILRDDYTEDDLKSWFVKEGVVMLSAILVATAAVVITLSTLGVGGVAMAMVLSAGAGAVGGMAGAEIGHVLSEEIGQKVYGETFTNKSLLGKYIADERVFNPETGQYEEIPLAELAEVYGMQFVSGFVLTFAMLGLGRMAGMALSNFAAKHALSAGQLGVLARLLNKLPKLTAQQINLMEEKGMKEFLRRFARESLEEVGEESAENFAARVNGVLGFLVSVYNCLDGRNVEISLGKFAVVAEGNEQVVSDKQVKVIANFSYDAAVGGEFLDVAAKRYEADGYVSDFIFESTPSRRSDATPVQTISGIEFTKTVKTAEGKEYVSVVRFVASGLARPGEAGVSGADGVTPIVSPKRAANGRLSDRQLRVAKNAELEKENAKRVSKSLSKEELFLAGTLRNLFGLSELTSYLAVQNQKTLEGLPETTGPTVAYVTPVIGAGGFGAVRRIFYVNDYGMMVDKVVKSPVNLKGLDSSDSAEDKLVSGSAEDAKLKGELIRIEGKALVIAAEMPNHPNVMGVYKKPVRDTDGNEHFLFERAGDISVREYVEATHFNVSMAKKLIFQVMDGMAHIHKFGAIHRDLKWKNVIVDSRTGRAVIIDMGTLSALSDSVSPQMADLAKVNAEERSVLSNSSFTLLTTPAIYEKSRAGRLMVRDMCDGKFYREYDYLALFKMIFQVRLPDADVEADPVMAEIMSIAGQAGYADSMDELTSAYDKLERLRGKNPI